MSFGLTEIKEALDNGNIDAVLSDYVYTDVATGLPVTMKAKFNALIIPSSLSAQASTVNYYPGVFDGGLEYGQMVWTVNCRAGTYAQSRTIAETVFTELNRSNDNNWYCLCSMLETVKPQDETDNYNTVVEVTLKFR